MMYAIYNAIDTIQYIPCICMTSCYVMCTIYHILYTYTICYILYNIPTFDIMYYITPMTYYILYTVFDIHVPLSIHILHTWHTIYNIRYTTYDMEVSTLIMCWASTEMPKKTIQGATDVFPQLEATNCIPYSVCYISCTSYWILLAA